MWMRPYTDPALQTGHFICYHHRTHHVLPTYLLAEGMLWANRVLECPDGFAIPARGFANSLDAQTFSLQLLTRISQDFEKSGLDPILFT